MGTPDATRDFRDQFSSEFGRAFYRRFDNCVVSSIGIGTYLGDPTDAVDAEYHDAIVTAFDHGVNVVDTAVNYRHQRSERVIGRVLDAEGIDREAILLATKGGFLPFDGSQPPDPREYLQTEYIQSGLIDTDDLAGGMHCMTPRFIDAMVSRSRDNLGVEAIDIYYVHNPEMQLQQRSREAVYDQLERVFETLEERVAAGHLRSYGIATWEALRVPPEHDQFLSLREITARARAAAETTGRSSTGFRAVQLPFNVVMADAFTVIGHEGPEGPKSALQFALDAGLSVFTSASLAQGQLVRDNALPQAVAELLPGDTPAQRAINFARSGPGVTTALVGMKSQQHVVENIGAGTFDAMGARAFDRTFA